MKNSLKQLALICLLATTASTLGCQGETGPAGSGGTGAFVDNKLNATEAAPGIQVTILAVDGASGLDGTFQVGDRPKLTFSVRKDDGTDWELSELSGGTVLVSGPTFNYQRVIAELSDVRDSATDNGDGTWTYTLPVGLPGSYLAPLNDTAAFGAPDGELAGELLLAGSYTIGLRLTWDYSVAEESFVDAGDAIANVPLLGASSVQEREVSLQQSCTACHGSLRAHDGGAESLTLCLLCHTAGAEDLNGLAGGGTPGVTIDFKVMVHKIHSGAHLPSVLGIATRVDGSRDYSSVPVPYRLVGGDGALSDYSSVEFPRWPSAAHPMPRDLGYSSLTATEKGLEDLQRSGVVDCDACHGDPDGSGPLVAPAQGSQAFQQPSRAACGACHDDVDWDLPYNSDAQTMPFDMDDGTCKECHLVAGDALAVEDAHRHPMLDPSENPGLNIELVSALEAGNHNADGTLDAGEGLVVRFFVTDDLGNEIDPVDLVKIDAVLCGPTSNLNLVLNTAIPNSALLGPQPYQVKLPERQELEFLGAGTGALDSFQADFAPLWDHLGIPSELFVSTGSGVGALMQPFAPAGSNFIDVSDGALFAKDDVLSIDGGLPSEEYMVVQWVQGDRLWFGSSGQADYKPATSSDHGPNSIVEIVELATLAVGVDFEVDLDGNFTELIERGVGARFVATYTADFALPTRFPTALNDSPDVDESWGKWAGKSIVDGTYRLGLWTGLSFEVSQDGELNSYPRTAAASWADLLVGSAAVLEPYDSVADFGSCAACHGELDYHGGTRRGAETCILCHGTAGAEDRAEYRAPGAAPTSQTMVKFRELLHKIHRGKQLVSAASYSVNGYGPQSAYPNNFSVHQYGDIEFPAMPGGTKACVMCHGSSDAWQAPADLEHPTEGLLPSRSWRAACGSCHDGAAVHAHIDAQTSPSGVESCAICHDDASELDTEFVHDPRM